MHGELVWWDERFVSGPIAAQNSAPAVIPACAAASHNTAPNLQATVELEDEYLRDMVVAAFRRRPEWEVRIVERAEEEPAEGTAGSHLHWGEYEGIDWERVHRGDQIASSYCIRKGLIRKAHLAHNLKKWNAKHPGGRLARAVPETLVMVLDDVDYFEEALSDVYEVRDMEEGSQTWIAKPSITNQALGICIFDRVSTLRAAIEENPDLREWVLQRYIERPLLLGGRKFHLRAYVLCVGSLRSYVFSEMLALFAGEVYQHGGAHLQNLTAHLTNTCHLARNGGLWREEDVVRLASELIKDVMELGMSEGEATSRLATMHSDVNDIVGSCMEAISSELTFFTLPNCFELFGFDFLVDESWNVWLLEANAEPDMKQTGERLKSLIDNLVEGTLQLVADPFAEKQGCPGIKSEAEPTDRLKGGHWVKVFDKKQRGAGEGLSGIRMQG